MENFLSLLNMRKQELTNYRQTSVKRLEKLRYKGVPKLHIRIDSTKNQIYIREKGNRSKGVYLANQKMIKAEQIAT